MSDNKIKIIDLREQFFRVSNNVFKQDLNIYEIGVYTAICRFVNNDTKMAYPSLQKITDLLKISKRQVIRCIKILVDKGIIFKKQGKENICNQYYLLSINSDCESIVTVSHQGGDCESPKVVTVSQPKKTNIKKLIKKTKEKIKYPDSLNNKEFIDKYNEFIEMRKSIKKPIKTTIAINKQLNFLQQFDLDTALKMIDKSIMNEWKGLFELEENSNSGGAKSWVEKDDEEIAKYQAWEVNKRKKKMEINDNVRKLVS